MEKLKEKICTSKAKRYVDLRERCNLPKSPAKEELFKDHFLSRRADANPTYLVTYSGKYLTKFIVRLSPIYIGIRKGIHNVLRECDIYQKLTELHFPVPKVYYTQPWNSEVFDDVGTQFYIREYVEGVNFVDASLKRLYAENGYPVECSLGMKEKQTVYQSAIEALARLHASKEMVQYLESYPWTVFNDIMQPFRDPRPQFSESFNFNGFWEWRIKLWCNICEQDDLQVVSSLVASLKKEHKSKLLKVFMHGDFNFRNLVFDYRTLKVKAILDFEMSCLGDASCDLAEFMLCLFGPQDFNCPENHPLLNQMTCQDLSQEKFRKDLFQAYLRSLSIYKLEMTPQKLYPNFKKAIPVACLRFISIFSKAQAEGYEGHEFKGSACDGDPIKALLYMANKYM